MSITLEDTKGFSVAELTGLPAKELMQLQSAATDALKKAKELKDWIAGSLDRWIAG